MVTRQLYSLHYPSPYIGCGLGWSQETRPKNLNVRTFAGSACGSGAVPFSVTQFMLLPRKIVQSQFSKRMLCQTPAREGETVGVLEHEDPAGPPRTSHHPNLSTIPSRRPRYSRVVARLENRSTPVLASDQRPSGIHSRRSPRRRSSGQPPSLPSTPARGSVIRRPHGNTRGGALLACDGILLYGLR